MHGKVLVKWKEVLLTNQHLQ